MLTSISDERWKKTILTIDDEGAFRDALTKILRKMGFSALEAGDGTTAIDLFRVQAPLIDLVLLDVTLPGMSGHDVLKELRKIRPDVKVILMSVYGREHALAAMGGEQVSLYIRKPFRLPELIDLIHGTCAD